MNEHLEWELLQVFEAVFRWGSLTAAAKALETSQSTVSRQMARLEALAGSPLIVRTSPVQLTERGHALHRALGPMIDSALLARAALSDRLEPEGNVTVTCVGEVLRWVLIDGLPDFCENFPKISLRFLINNRVDSLAADQADIALRFFRPKRGDLVAKKLVTTPYAWFVAKRFLKKKTRSIPWLGLCGALSEIAEQRHVSASFPNRPARILVEDLEALGRMVEAGLGCAYLPQGFGERLRGVVETTPERIDAQDHGPVLARDLWLVVHRSKQKVPKIRAVVDWLTTRLAVQSTTLRPQA